MGNNPIAMRQLHIQGDKNKTYRVEIYTPEKISDGTYRCRVHLEGAPEGLNKVDIGGQDSYEALMLAVQAIPSMVDVYNKQYMNSKLRWFSNDEDLHFNLDLLKPTKS